MWIMFVKPCKKHPKFNNSFISKIWQVSAYQCDKTWFVEFKNSRSLSNLNEPFRVKFKEKLIIEQRHVWESHFKNQTFWKFNLFFSLIESGSEQIPFPEKKTGSGTKWTSSATKWTGSRTKWSGSGTKLTGAEMNYISGKMDRILN